MKKKLLIGCGVLLALGVVAVIALSKFGRTVDGQLVGSIGFQKIEVQPESPFADETVSLKLDVTFTGKGATPAGGLPLEATVELGKLPEGTHTFVIAILRPAHGLVGPIEPPREVQVIVQPNNRP